MNLEIQKNFADTIIWKQRYLKENWLMQGTVIIRKKTVFLQKIKKYIKI